MADEPLLPQFATKQEQDEVKTSLQIGWCSWLFRCPFLSSSKSTKQEDPFKYSKEEFHEFGHDMNLKRTAKGGKKFVKMIDECGAVCLMVGPLAWMVVGVSGAVWKFMRHVWHRDLDSMAIVMFANSIIELVIVLGVALMWYTMCYWSDKVHNFWKQKVWPLPSLMPGGFMPRMAAFSLGILMFTTSTLVTEGRVPGAQLMNKFHTDHWQYCRATDISAVKAPWYGRILTRPPVVSEGYRCFHAQKKTISTWFGSWNSSLALQVNSFNQQDVQHFFNATDGVLLDSARGVGRPAKDEDLMGVSVGFPMDELVKMGLLNETTLPHFSFQCMYQCTKWKTVGLIAVIKNAGTIVAGSAVVVKTSDMISKRFGGLFFTRCCCGTGCMIGLPLINADTTAETIKRVIQRTQSLPGKGRSKIFAAFTCLLATFPLRFASKIDSNGYYTVDYYVTAVFFSSLLMALVMRQWNPYKMSRIAYTEDMWLNGEDSFVDFKSHTHRKINLYEWIHLNPIARRDHLLGYARKLTIQDIDAELGTRKSLKGLETDIHDLENPKDDATDPPLSEDEKKAKETERTHELGDKKTEATKILNGAQKNVLQKASKGTPAKTGALLFFTIPDANTKSYMVKKYDELCKENNYHNNYANLIVKTIQEIPVVTESPPLPDEWTQDSANNIQLSKGATVSKYVVLHEGAIGTVVEKVDKEHIKVRFPKVCPGNAPTHGLRKDKPQYELNLRPTIPEAHESAIHKWIREGHNSVFKTLTGTAAASSMESGSKYDDLFEDVVVSLEQIIEASQQWVEIQDAATNFGTACKVFEIDPSGTKFKEACQAVADEDREAKVAKKVAEGKGKMTEEKAREEVAKEEKEAEEKKRQEAQEP